MTSSVKIDSIEEIDGINTIYTNKDPVHHKNRELRHILKSKENTYKHKCRKSLKRKLKKYKLRQDGAEDQDVLDVSNILVSSLVIKSPNYLDALKENGDRRCESDIEELRPKNYLFKMVRRKETVRTSNSLKGFDIDIKQNETFAMSDAISQEKKHTNAFQLLMDSRNKSIGANSPGKDKVDDQSDGEEITEKKNLKAKRNLILQKMADAKGYLKNKEIEEYQDKIIKNKMDKRAERLKKMILKETKPAEVSSHTKTKVADSLKSHHKDGVKLTNNNDLNKQAKAFRIVDIFNTLNDPIVLSPERNEIPKEDKEFLKKLSPSLKKKESMLSYFKKVDKEPEPVPIEDNDNIIKVKLQVKTKKKGKKKTLSLKRDATDLDNILDVNDENNELACVPQTSDAGPVPVEASESKVTGERQKRKRNTKINDPIYKPHTAPESECESRPKRSIKRPVKYIDDVCLSSSDDELHVFTPKKKKHDSVNIKQSPNTESKHTIDTVKHNADKKSVKEQSTPKKPVKLAPIFAPKQLDPAALEAKQRFLQSGVPDKLKKIIQQQKNHNIHSSNFPAVVHVQQRDSALQDINLPILHVLDEDIVDTLIFEENALKKLLDLNEVSVKENNINNYKQSTQELLHTIKQLHPKFPVYRTYRYLRGKGKGEIKDYNVEFDNSIEVINDVVDVTNDNPDILNWTAKYKPMSTNQIIGNFESTKELRKWLISWNETKSKSRVNAGSDSSDYYQSDTDSRDSIKSVNNLLILTGPTGCGKTSSVYAVAAELAMKVIEVNASSKRTGKIMLQDLQEATQSHKVNRGTDSSQKSQEKKSNSLTETLKKRRGRPKKSAEGNKKELEKVEALSSTPLSQESTRTDMSLILIDDADIVFDQDDGFSSAILQLVQCSKRPVILITSSLVCSHLQRFLQYGKILKLNPLIPRLLGTWLDIMCVADCGISWPGVGAKFLDYFKGDIRKTINFLQFYISNYAHLHSEEEVNSQNVDSCKLSIDDENSSMSWADREDLEFRKLTPVFNSNIDVESNTMWTDFIERNTILTNFRYPVELFDIWWSVPQLLNIRENVCNIMVKTDKLQKKRQNILELEAIADTLDAISLSDYISPNCSKSSFNITADPWYTPESHSVSEQENMDYYSSRYEVSNEICHTLLTSCIAVAQDTLSCDRRKDISFPGMALQRERDKIVSRHKSLTTYLSPWATLDRRSLALDYWSSCRTICRIEKCKSDANISTKRNNRFCHYLKSLSVLCKSNTFDNLCDSLSNQGTDLSLLNINE